MIVVVGSGRTTWSRLLVYSFCAAVGFNLFLSFVRRFVRLLFSFLLLVSYFSFVQIVS